MINRYIWHRYIYFVHIHIMTESLRQSAMVARVQLLQVSGQFVASMVASDASVQYCLTS